MIAARFSILTPVCDPPVAVLERMLASVAEQTFGDWEHCLVDDGSTDPAVLAALEAAVASDGRRRLVRRAARGGIVAATQAALDLATGEFIALLDHDDELAPDALQQVADRLDGPNGADIDVLYTDEDKVDLAGTASATFVKPRWSPDRLLGQMYLGHLGVYRRSLVHEVGGFRPGYDGAQDWDLALRATERARRIDHVPTIAYHWRTVEGSSAAAPDAKPWAHDASRRAVDDALQRRGIEAVAAPVPGHPGAYWLRPELRTRPLVSVIVPTAGRSAEVDGRVQPLVVNCLRSVLERSTYEELEFVVVIDDHAPQAVRAELQALLGDRLRLVEFTEPFNFSRKVNVGVAAASGDHLLVLNDDIEVLPDGWRPARARDGGPPIEPWPLVDAAGRRTWIEAMLVYALQADIGCVGAKLYYPDGKLQHVGVVARFGTVTHSYHREPGATRGYWGNLVVPTDHLAVTGACLLLRRSTFDAVGGFDETLPLNYNDVDLCLKVHAAGLRNVLLPHVELLHRESSSRGVAPARPEEVAALQARWGQLLHDDPYYDARFVDNDFNLRRARHPAVLARRARNAYLEGGFGSIARSLRRRLLRQG